MARNPDHVRIKDLMVAKDLRMGVEQSAKIVAPRPRRI
jgi:hypothetical protein